MKKILLPFLALAVIVCGLFGFSSLGLGLKYELNENETGYIVKGSGFFTGGNVVIKEEHEGKPVIEIAEEGFKGSFMLKSITIPSSIRKVGKGAFSPCKNLKNVYYSGSVSEWAGINFEDVSANPLWNSADEKHDVKLYIDDVLLTEAFIKTSSVKNNAFAGYKHLTKISLSNVEKIGEQAFSNCLNLKDVTLGSSLKEIGEHSFRLCISLEEITIPRNVKLIDEYAFNGCDALKTAKFEDLKSWLKDGARVEESDLKDKENAAKILLDNLELTKEK